MAATPPPHLVLARKWRPERFGELVGQEHVTRTLIEALKRGRIAHAFLFAGIRGVGKTTAARILARCLNCETGPSPEPCGECAACQEIRTGRSLDVVEIDGATYRKIDDARAIIENLSYRPARDRFKIYIIDEAHQLTDQAFNALLKTLEEPPAHVKFILATTEPQKMPETILSRLQRYDFRRIAYATVVERLKDLASREGVEAEEGALRLLAREAGGSMRDAERMLETAVASSGGTVSEAGVAASLGVASREAVLRLCDSILGKDAARALAGVRELHRRGANLESLGRDLLETLRNLAAAKLPAEGAQSPLDELPDHEAAEIRKLAAGASARDLMRLFRLMAGAQEEIMRSPYPDLLLEMAVIRMASLAPVMDADELMRAIGGTQSGGAEAKAAARVPTPPVAPEPAQSSGTHKLKVEGEVKATAPLRAPEGERVRELPELRDRIRDRRPALAGFMEHGAALSVADDVVRVVPLNEIYIRYLSDNRAVIAELASEVYGRTMRVELVANGAAAQSSAAEADAPRPDGPAASREKETTSESPGSPPVAQSPGSNADERRAIVSHPAVRKILDAFDARLVEVRATGAATDTKK